MIREFLLRGASICIVLGLVSVPPPACADEASDLADARALFETNLDAIRQRDRAAYLATYWESERLARSGPAGMSLGFEEHAAQGSDDSWPDVFDGTDLRLVWIRPGLVYGTYRYRVSYAGDEHRGISERMFLETAEGWRIAMTSAFDVPSGTPPPPTALVGGTLIDGTGSAAVTDAVVVIRGGLIDCAGSRDACSVPDDIEIIDTTGRWITPGIVDAHVHFSQTGWADGRPDSLDVRDSYPYESVQADLRAHPERFARSQLCSGVTAVFDVGGYPWTFELQNRFEGDTLAPHVATSGPLVSTLDYWLNLPAEKQFLFLDDEESGRKHVRYLASHGSDAVKVWFLPVSDRDFDEMASAIAATGEEAHARDLPLIVHATGHAEAKAALSAGADMLVHSVWDQGVDDEFIALARKAQTIYCPTLTVIEGYQRMNESVLSGEPPTVDDPNGCVDGTTLARVAATSTLSKELVDAEQHERGKAGTAERIATMQHNLKRVHAAGIPIAMGTDAGNPLTLHGPSVYAEMEAMQAAGLSATDVLVASTKGGASAMRRDGDFGTIEAGKIADLLVMTADPTQDIANMRELQLVIRGGEVRNVEELKPAVP